MTTVCYGDEHPCADVTMDSGLHHGAGQVRPTVRKRLFLGLVLALGLGGPALVTAEPRPPKFRLQEASITDIHKAIRRGRITCRQLVEAFYERAQAYNGICTQLVTEDGAPVPDVPGTVRAGKPIEFPTATVPVWSILPDLDQYVGLPLDLGRMEPTVSDPSVWQQHGMRVGMPNAGQLNALQTLNIRGERSVTCQGACDAPPSQPLHAECPSPCAQFRLHPDALERAAELDARYKNKPPLDDLPMYCIPVAVKDPYDTKDMRTTSNNDVDFAMDAPPSDSTVVARMRASGAIIYAKANAHEFNGGPGDPGGPSEATNNLIAGGYGMGSWGGQPCNPYDTERVPRGSSSGSGVAVAANLATIAICEQTGASCQGPASRNNVVNILTTKALLPGNGGIGNQFFVDRAGILGKTVRDAAIALDAVKDPDLGYFDPTDIYSALPRSLVPAAPYSSFAVDEDGLKPEHLKGIRIGIVREYMVKSNPNMVAITDKLDAEFKSVLRDQLGAELVESFDPAYGDDPDVPNVEYTFQDAFAEVLPRLYPEAFSRSQFAVPGEDVTSYDYLFRLSTGQAPLSPNVNLRIMTGGFSDNLTFRFEMDRYLLARGDMRVVDWASWVANAKFREDDSRAGAENWTLVDELVSTGKTNRFAMSHIMRLILNAVMYRNGIDVLVNPENTIPPRKIGGPSVGSDTGPMSGMTPLLQIPQITVPAGYNQIQYEPRYTLNTSRTSYNSVLTTEQSLLPNPMPISIVFWAGQGEEPMLIRVASAYEAATKHRVPPPAFGPVPGEP